MRLHEINNKIIKELLDKYFEFGQGDYGYKIVNDFVYAISETELIEETKFFPIKFAKADDNFYCSQNILISLKGCPIEVGGNFSCQGNYLNDLIGGPKKVNDSYHCHNNPLTSLEGLPESVGKTFTITWNENLGLLPLLNIKNLQNIDIRFNNKGTIIGDIMNKYIGLGKKGMLQCAAELTKAGFKNNARL